MELGVNKKSGFSHSIIVFGLGIAAEILFALEV
jgi:hypothetical protein